MAPVRCAEPDPVLCGAETERTAPGRFRVSVRGVVDAHTAPVLLRGALDLVPDGVDHVEIDLSPVRVLGAAGINELVRFVRHVPESTTIRVIAPEAPAPDVLRIVGLDTLTRTEAAGAIRRRLVGRRS